MSSKSNETSPVSHYEDDRKGSESTQHFRRFFLVWGADRFSHVLELGVESFLTTSFLNSSSSTAENRAFDVGKATGLQFRRNSLSGLWLPVRTGAKDLSTAHFPISRQPTVFQQIKQFASSNLKAPSIGTRDILKRSRKTHPRWIREVHSGERAKSPKEDAR